MLTVNVDTSHAFVKISTNKMHKIVINPQQYREYLHYIHALLQFTE
jgi:hypothetical protein